MINDNSNENKDSKDSKIIKIIKIVKIINIINIVKIIKNKVMMVILPYEAVRSRQTNYSFSSVNLTSLDFQLTDTDADAAVI